MYDSIAIQQTTLITADNHREIWTEADLEFVAEFESESCESLAITLGRSLYAIWSIRTTLEERRAKIVRDRARALRARGRVYTYLPGDCPEDFEE